MKFIIIGLGSMGKRRIRNLQALGHTDITGFDPREDRRKEAENLYGIKTVDSHGELSAYDAVFVCVPPDLHMHYAQKAYESGVHAFIEAGMFDDGMEELWENVRVSDLKFYASSTMMFNPLIMKIKELTDAGSIGKLLNFSYHAGSYLPLWHPWEGLDFYGSKRGTGACREMVVFDLAWINWIFGDLEDAKSFFSKTSGLDMEADDVYAMILKYPCGLLGTYMVDIVSRNNSIRRLIINGEKGQIFWDWEENKIKLYDGDENLWVHYIAPKGTSVSGYNSLIAEEMYINEVRAFISSVENDTQVAHTLGDDLKNVAALRMIERA